MNTNGHKLCGRPPPGGEDFQRITITLDVIADQRNETLAADALLNLVDRLRQEGVETAWLTLEISCPLHTWP
ncbi:MAG: hypothetical protein ACRD0O_19060 [Acidimicrobiia bacterium]